MFVKRNGMHTFDEKKPITSPDIFKRCDNVFANAICLIKNLFLKYPAKSFV